MTNFSIDQFAVRYETAESFLPEKRHGPEAKWLLRSPPVGAIHSATEIQEDVKNLPAWCSFLPFSKKNLTLQLSSGDKKKQMLRRTEDKVVLH